MAPNERTDQNSRKTTKQQKNSQPPDTEFKSRVIRMLTEMVEYGHKIEEKVKAMLDKNKEKYTGNQQ